jgi:two-component system, sensor histidine kinase PdtaS
MQQISKLESESNSWHLGEHRCLVYDTEERHRLVVTQYLVTGLERHERVLYLGDAHSAPTITDYLTGAGIDAARCQAENSFVWSAAGDAYAPGGEFFPERMLTLLNAETAQALHDGYEGLRVTGEMTWALWGIPGSQRLVEYEESLDGFIRELRCLALCQYDRNAFGQDFMLTMMATHHVL